MYVPCALCAIFNYRKQHEIIEPVQLQQVRQRYIAARQTSLTPTKKELALFGVFRRQLATIPEFLRKEVCARLLLP